MNRKILNAILVISAVVCTIAVGIILIHNAENRQSAKNFASFSDTLQSIIDSAEAEEAPEVTLIPEFYATRETPPPTETSAPGQAAAPSPGETGEAQPTSTPVSDPRLLAYRQIAADNPEFVGWIKIEGTNIDYPVMRSPGDPEKYLRTGFDGEESRMGTPFMLPATNPETPSDHITIYGHHMKGGGMFGQLARYEDPAFFAAHQVIAFDTLWARNTYQILAVFRTSIGSDTEFPYYKYIDFYGEDDFEAYTLGAKAIALYDTGVEARYGEQLLSLSTCDYHEPNGRLVVLAKRIEAEESAL